MAEQQDQMLQRLFPDILGRLLHQPLFQRVSEFCARYSPELPADGIVQMWLQRFYAGDTDFIVLVRLNNTMQIVEHAVAEIRRLPGYNLIHLYQLQLDKANPQHADEFVEHLTKIAQLQGCTFFVAQVQEHVKAYERKYKLKPISTTMIKNLTVPDTVPDSEEE